MIGLLNTISDQVNTTVMMMVITAMVAKNKYKLNLVKLMFTFLH